jgi:hypothetical protein
MRKCQHSLQLREPFFLGEFSLLIRIRLCIFFTECSAAGIGSDTDCAISIADDEDVLAALWERTFLELRVYRARPCALLSPL